MPQDLLTTYRLTVLYLLAMVDFEMTNTQVCNFFLEKEYTNYLKAQEAINSLVSDKMIVTRSLRNRTLLSLTEEGKCTLEYCKSNLNAAIREDILQYLKINKMKLKNEYSIQSDYYKLNNGFFEVKLCAKEAENNLVQICLSVPTEEMAKSVSLNWHQKNASVYQYLTEQLF